MKTKTKAVGVKAKGTTKVAPKPTNLSRQVDYTAPQAKDWEKEFERLSNPEYQGEDSLLYGSNGIPSMYPESMYELDSGAVIKFIHSLLHSNREEFIKEILRWAEKDIGKKCAKTDFIYQHLLKLQGEQNE